MSQNSQSFAFSQRLLQALDAKIAPLREELDKLMKLRAESLRELQASCLHPVSEVVRGAYRPEGIITYADPPFLVCKACGYGEEEWGCGAWKLSHASYDPSVPELPREEARKLCVTFVRQADMERLGRWGRGARSTGAGRAGSVVMGAKNDDLCPACQGASPTSDQMDAQLAANGDTSGACSICNNTHYVSFVTAQEYLSRPGNENI